MIGTHYFKLKNEMNKHLLLIALVAMPALSIAAEKDPIAEANIRKALTSAGGEKRFKTIKAPTMWMETGTYYGMGQGVPFVAQYATYWPKRWYRQLTEGQFALGVAGDEVTLFNGAPLVVTPLARRAIPPCWDGVGQPRAGTAGAGRATGCATGSSPPNRLKDERPPGGARTRDELRSVSCSDLRRGATGRWVADVGDGPWGWAKARVGVAHGRHAATLPHSGSKTG